ncbi:MAG: hypothetical protein NVSMB54_16440 [Ktedonobacteraceae bacterium]
MGRAYLTHKNLSVTSPVGTDVSAVFYQTASSVTTSLDNPCFISTYYSIIDKQFRQPIIRTV